MSMRDWYTSKNTVFQGRGDSKHLLGKGVRLGAWAGAQRQIKIKAHPNKLGKSTEGRK